MTTILKIKFNFNYMKKDIQQINAIAKEYNMTNEQRREFGDFLEDEKARGRQGTKNDRGDYTYEELRKKAIEFLEN